MNTSDTGRQRDAGSLRIVGCFFVILGGLVLFASFWARDNPRAMIVNLSSGAVLAVIGGVMVTVSARYLSRRPSSEDSQPVNPRNSGEEL